MFNLPRLLVAHFPEVKMSEAKKLIDEVLKCEGWPSHIHALAYIAQKAIEQRDDWITSTNHKEWYGKFIRRDNAELDAIAAEGGSSSARGEK